MEGCFGCLHAAVALPYGVILLCTAISRWWKKRKERLGIPKA